MDAVAVLGALASNGSLEGLENIGGQVVGILDTAAETDKVVKDTNKLALLLGDTSVGHAAGKLDKRLDTTKRLGEGEDASLGAEALGSSVAALDAEGEHTAAHGVTVLLDGDGALGVGVEAGVVDGNDVGRGLEGGGDGGSVAGGLAGAEVEGLEAAVGEPAVKGRGDGANGVLEEREALVEVIRVEGGDAHDDVGVAVDVLCDGVDDNVGAVVERVLDVGGEEGVVDDDEDVLGAGDGDNGGNVDEAQGRVAGGLDPDEAGVGGDVLVDVDLDLRGEGDLDAVGLGDLREVAVGAAVDVGHGDDVGAGGEALEDVGRGGRAGGVGEGVLCVLEGGDGVLKVGAVGVGGARVLVLADGLGHGRLGKSCGQRDRLDDGAGGGVVRRAGVDGEGAEATGSGGRGAVGGAGGHCDFVCVLCVCVCVFGGVQGEKREEDLVLVEEVEEEGEGRGWLVNDNKAVVCVKRPLVNTRLLSSLIFFILLEMEDSNSGFGFGGVFFPKATVPAWR